ncbi:MAG: tetratricopeptide repeat protein [Patescibacteria group bacterium]
MNEQKKDHSLFSSVLFLSVFGIAFLVPLFFLPLNTAPFQFSKVLLTEVLITIALGAYIVGSLKRGSFSFGVNGLIGSLYLLPIGYAISSLFSQNPYASFVGYQFNTDTFAFIVLGVLVTHLTTFALTEKIDTFNVLIGVLLAGWVVFIFQFFQFVATGFLPLSTFSEPSGNLVGQWNDLALYVGLIASLALFSRESLVLAHLHRFALSLTIVVAMVFLVIINSTIAWVLVGCAALMTLILVLVRRFSSPSRSEKISTWGIFPGILLVASLLFVLGWGNIADRLQGRIQDRIGISVVEVRPSLQSTIGILSAVYNKSPLVGSGPNTFDAMWLLHRTPDIVQSPFWNIAFTAGASTILTAFTTGGIVVSLAWVLFIGILLFTIVRSLLVLDVSSRQTYFVTSVTALGTLYLLAAHVFYTPSQSMSILFFLFVGLFLASLHHTPLFPNKTISLRESSRMIFPLVTVGVVAVVLSLTALYSGVIKYQSAFTHQQALVAAQERTLAEGVELVNRSIALEPQDRYYHTLAILHLAEVNAVASGSDTSEEAQRKFQNALAGAIEATGHALQKNQNNFEYHMTRALVYGSVVPLGIEGALENALLEYDVARKINPLSPEIDLRLAELYAAVKEYDKAESAIRDALLKKADYTPAILLRANIALSTGNLDEAIASVKNAVYFEPQNSVLLYQLGILLLQNESYEDAQVAFELALVETPDYANAAFFLAQAYAFQGRFADAAILMDRLSEKNPDNEVVKAYRDALSQGENPFVVVPTAPESEEEGISESVE